MTTQTPTPRLPPDRPTDSFLRLLVPLFGLTLFLSASLLFWIQPLFAKLALPLLGGSPLVWNTALLFFQAVLLAGYAYAHLTTRWLRPRIQPWVHALVLALGFVSLPVTIRGGFMPEQDPTLGLLSLLASSIGLPFFAVSATAPLLQRWFAYTAHGNSKDPYFLYGASNLGSMLALLAFPFVLEPALTLRAQGSLWAVGFGVLMVLIGCCAVASVGLGKQENFEAFRSSLNVEHDPVTWSQRLHWVALAAVPSSLLLGVTQHITMDIAAIPLLWVIPLSLYLLTFVLVFARRPLLPHSNVIRFQPFVLGLAGVYVWTPLEPLTGVALHLAVFFVLALACHGELARWRPDVGRLTEFYFYMSVGGVLGGSFNVLLAPVLFDGLLEYGLAVGVACMLRPGPRGGSRRQVFMDVGGPAMVLGMGVLVGIALRAVPEAYFAPAYLAALVTLVVIVFGFSARPIRYGLGVLALLVAIGRATDESVVVHRARSFFGVYRVVFLPEDNANVLSHGTTVHGTQLLSDEYRNEPTGYYSREGPLGQTFEALRNHRPSLRVGLVGLGVGSALCHAQPGDDWQVFEIDPLVADLARDERYFHLWEACGMGSERELFLGDARLQLEKSPDGSFDLLILDAYSSDSIPVHLLTRDALDLYTRKLVQGGILLFHISNRYLRLDTVLSAITYQANLAALVQEHNPTPNSPPMAGSSKWVAIAETSDQLSGLAANGAWSILEKTDLPPWTDDHSNIFQFLR